MPSWRSAAPAVGKNDNLVDEPDKCTFDPNSLLCKGADAADCLTAAQVDLLTQEYAGPKNPRTGQIIFPGPAKGAELTAFADVQPMGVALDLFRYPAFNDANWDFTSMDWDKVLKAAEDKLGPLLHVDADLTPFFARGGKMLFYIGWNDGLNPLQLADYISQVKNSSGANAADAIRMFAIPGMGHCGRGEGSDTFNRLSAMDNWVDKGQAPERMLAMKVVDGDILRSRPVCAYPAVAKYDGNGDINDATNFACAAD